MTHQVYTPAEVAEILKVHRSTVYRMIQDGAITALSVRSQWRITEAALREFIGDPESNPDTYNYSVTGDF